MPNSLTSPSSSSSLPPPPLGSPPPAAYSEGGCCGGCSSAPSPPSPVLVEYRTALKPTGTEELCVAGSCCGEDGCEEVEEEEDGCECCDKKIKEEEKGGRRANCCEEVEGSEEDVQVVEGCCSGTSGDWDEKEFDDEDDGELKRRTQRKGGVSSTLADPSLSSPRLPLSLLRQGRSRARWIYRNESPR